MFFDIYTSISELQINKSKIINENTVCLIISNFILFFPLLFIIDFRSLIPLTAREIIQGINKIFCNNTFENKNIIPLP